MESQTSLVYLAKPIYGGWVTFTVHLAKKYGYSLYKVAKRNEKQVRSFGYDVSYKNVTIDTLQSIPNLLLTAVDKHYWHVLPMLPEGTRIVIHDPTELKESIKNPNPLIQDNQLLRSFKVYTIRETVQKYLLDMYDIKSECKFHPFYEYTTNKDSHQYHSVSISRIDFDKNTDILLKANKLLSDDKKIRLFGAENRLYVHHKLRELDFDKYWNKGHRFDREYPLQYKGKDILKKSRFVIDMSTIKNDGGGTQYTFLEAIYQDCVLILHKQWVNQGTLFKDGINCLAVETPEELAHILNSESPYEHIVTASKLLLQNHINVMW